MSGPETGKDVGPGREHTGNGEGVGNPTVSPWIRVPRGFRQKQETRGKTSERRYFPRRIGVGKGVTLVVRKQEHYDSNPSINSKSVWAFSSNSLYCTLRLVLQCILRTFC